MLYAMVTYPYDATGINGAYVFTTVDEAREACAWANKVYGLVKSVNSWEVMAFSEFTYKELVREYPRIQGHKFWQDVGCICKDSAYTAVDKEPLNTPMSLTGKDMEVKVSEIKENQFFLIDGELYVMMNPTKDSKCQVKFIANVAMEYNRFAKPQLVDPKMKVNRVTFVLI